MSGEIVCCSVGPQEAVGGCLIRSAWHTLGGSLGRTLEWVG